MFLATSNEVKQVLLISYIGQVVPAELERGRQDGEKLMAGLRPGFRVLADFGRLEAMDTACVMSRICSPSSQPCDARQLRLVPSVEIPLTGTFSVCLAFLKYVFTSAMSYP